MKKVLKTTEPSALSSFRAAQPDANWEELRNDPFGGQSAYKDIRKQAITDQGGLCAYCEIQIGPDEYYASQVEHFHPKSAAPPPNWALEWSNMLAVCAGGTNNYGTFPHSLKPIKKNLSCDAHKNKVILNRELKEECEGWVLNPLDLLVLPSLFSLNKFDGFLSPNKTACAAADPWPGNHHASTEVLVQHTIDMLNLNCERLCKGRLAVVWGIERNKKKLQAAHIPASQALPQLAQRYLGTRWPEFFTTICLCLGNAADAHLQSVQYQG